MKIKVIVVDLELSKRTKRVVAALATGTLAVGITAVAYASVPHTWSDGDTLSASDLNGTFMALDSRVAAVEQIAEHIVKPTPYFSWTTVTAAASDVETIPVEGRQTITFAASGMYRVTLGSQCIHDNGTATHMAWALGGTAKRLDPLQLDGGGRLEFNQNGMDTRQVISTVIYASATAGQTLTLLPALTVNFSGGQFHEANFGYLVEFLGSP